jgi:hypothetical protein
LLIYLAKRLGDLKSVFPASWRSPSSRCALDKAGDGLGLIFMNTLNVPMIDKYHTAVPSRRP